MKPEAITSLDIRKLIFLDNIKVDLGHIWDGLDCNNLPSEFGKTRGFCDKDNEPSYLIKRGDLLDS